MPNLFRHIRPDERRATIGAVVTLFGLMAAHAMLETARDALFLASIPAEQLPWVYLTIAFVTFFVTQLGAQREAAPKARTLSLWILGSAIVTGLFRVLLLNPAPWGFYALYIWTGVQTTAVLLVFWTLLGDRFTLSAAKRVFAVVGTGSVSGAIAGSGLAGLLTQVVPAIELLSIASVILGLSALAPMIWLRNGVSAHPADPVESVSLTESFRAIRGDGYMQRIVVFVLVSAAGLTVADFLFKQAVAERFGPDELGQFFAIFYFVLNLVSLAVQTFGVSRLIRGVGVSASLTILPMGLLFGGVGILVGAGFYAAIVLKGVDGSLRHSLHRTASELMYVPIQAEVRSKLKAVTDVLGQRGGQAVASVAILIAVNYGANAVLLAAALVMLTATWSITALELKSAYIELVRGKVSDAVVDFGSAGAYDLPALDLRSFENVITALNSEHDYEVLAALDMLVDDGKSSLIPALILYHPSDEVVIAASQVFADTRREDFIAIADRVGPTRSSSVRAALLRARHSVQPDRALLEEQAAGSCAAERLTACVLLGASGWVPMDQIRADINAALRDTIADGRIALAQAIAFSGDPRFVPYLSQLANDILPEVRLAAVEGLIGLATRDLMPDLILRLGDREVRKAARRVIFSIGEEAIPALREAFDDPKLDQQTRWHLPGTLAVFDPRTVVPLMMDRLRDEEDGMVRYKLIRHLERMRLQDPKVPLEDAKLDEIIELTLARAYSLVARHAVIVRAGNDEPSRQTPVHQLLVDLLDGKRRHAVDRLLRLLSLRYRDPGISRARRALCGRRQQASTEVVAHGIELLELVLPPQLRTPVIQLLSPDPSLSRAAAAGRFHHPEADTYQELVASLLASSSEVVRTLAAYHASELGIDTLQRELDELRRDVSEPLRELVERALRGMSSSELAAAAG